MTSKTWSSGTVIDSSWLQDVDTSIYKANSGISSYIGNRSLLDKLSEYVTPEDFGATGGVDDTTALTAWFAHGGNLYMYPGRVYTITSPMVPVSNTKIFGNGASIKVKNLAAITGAVIKGTSVSNVAIYDLEINANIDNTGGYYGVWFSNGTNNTIENCYIHDTKQAGISIESETGSKVLFNRVVNCGRSGVTDNHGIMVFSTTATAVKNVLIQGNYVETAYRKGITIYSNTPGTVQNIQIIGNNCNGCGTVGMSGAGIYCANAVATTAQSSVLVSNNICWNNYVNIEIATSTGFICSNNICKADSGSTGIEIVDCLRGAITGNQIEDSSVHGINVTGSVLIASNLNITGNTIIRSNRITAGFGAGIRLLNLTYSIISSNIINDDAGSAKQTHGIYEDTGCDNNVFGANIVANVTAILVSISGANSNVYRPFYDTVASVAAVTLPTTADVITVTGTTNITSIGVVGCAGRKITLIFVDVLTVTDGNNLKLAGNFVTTADDTITLVCNGTNWYESSRSIN